MRTSRRRLLAAALLVSICACSKQQSSPPPATETKGLFNAPCGSNADCQGMMCRAGRCH